jgi:thiol-disulfide isomerase/thioredoxin
MQTLKTRISTLALIAGLATSAFAGMKVGDTFPELAGFKLEGALPDLKGKIVIVDFWASWCGPCKESFPAMNELQKKYGDKLVIIAVNVDESAPDKEAFLKENTADFTIVRDAKQKLVDQVEIGTMPSSFVLGRDGKVQFVHSGYFGGESKKKYVQEIDSLLGK